ncbi:hypothetical protein HK405_012908, partial [Cladochytrium tenue]
SGSMVHHMPYSPPMAQTAYSPHGPSGAAGNGFSASNTQQLAEENEGLREQLAKAQELLAKQNRLKFRLKSELSEARADSTAARSELAAARSAAARAQELDEELAAAKELLVAYKVELNATQEAHLWALDFVLRQSDSSFMDIELEVASVRHLLESPWTPLARDSDRGRSSLVPFMPPKKVTRVWEPDSDWDSDVDVDEELVWWREDRAAAARKRPPRRDHEDEEDDDVDGDAEANGVEFKYLGKGARPQSVVNRRLKAAVDARRRARLEREGGGDGATTASATDEDDPRDGTYTPPSASGAAGAVTDKHSEPVMVTNTVLAEEPEPEDDFRPEAALWTGVVKSKPTTGKPDATPRSRRDSLAVGSMPAAPRLVDAAPLPSWDSPAQAPSRDAASALWTGPVRSDSVASSRQPSVAGTANTTTEAPLQPVVELTGLWTGPVRKKKSPSEVSGASRATTAAAAATAAPPTTQPQPQQMTAEPADMDLDDLSAVVWNGSVKPARRSLVLDASSAPSPRRAPSGVGAGSVVSAASSRIRTAGAVGLRRPTVAVPDAVAAGTGLAGVLGMAAVAAAAADRRNSPPSPAEPPALAGFGDHARSPVPVARTGTAAVAGAATTSPTKTAAPATAGASSWFRPLRTWVESIGEQLTAAPATAAVAEADDADIDEGDFDRERQRLRDRDEDMRAAAAELLMASSGGDVVADAGGSAGARRAPGAMRRPSAVLGG